VTPRELGSLLFCLAVFVSFVAAAKRLTRRPLALAGPLALAMLIAYEVIALEALSMFHLVSAIPVTLANLVPIAAGLVLLKGTHRIRPLRIDGTWLKGIGRAIASHNTAAIAPLALIVLATAILLPPSNWDSMTYHMARVAYWFQNHSIAFYPTSSFRQNWMGPGSESLILVLQVLAGSDRWANSVQYLSWILCAISVPPLCRLLGLSRNLCRWAGAFAVTAPGALLQASTTQNDVVAAALLLAIVIAALSLWRPRSTTATRGLPILAVAISSGVLVKASAVIIALPLLLYLGTRWIRFLLGGQEGTKRLLARAVLISAGLAFLVLGAQVWRRASTPTPPWMARIFFAPFSEYRLRLFQLVASPAHHAGLPAASLAVAGRVAEVLHLEPAVLTTQRDVAGAVPVYGLEVFRWHEGLVGNPGQFWLGLVSLAGVVFSWTRLTGRARLAVALPCTGWIALHAFVRDTPWTQRFEIPIFMLLPAAWAALVPAPGTAGRVWRPVLIAGTLVCVAYGYVCATHIEGRPLSVESLRGFDRAAGYYVFQPALKPIHDQVLEELSRRHCDRLGLKISRDSFDYPLTWRAMQEGIEVRHILGPSTWPCLVFSDTGPPPDSPPWRAIDGGIYVPAR
jgi:hypothetical protein